MIKNGNKGLIENITIGDMVAEGKCITRYDNQAIFVEKVAPGDVADLKIVKKKKKYLEAVPVKFHEYSELRIDPFCEHFGTCGGCKWQHLSYQQQLNYKQQQVKDNLERIGGMNWSVFHDIISSPITTFYRNKLEFTFSNSRWKTPEEIESGKNIEDDYALGFHVPRRFDKVLDIKYCHLQPDPSNDIRNTIRNYAVRNNISFFDIIKQEGFLRNLIIRTTLKGEYMVILSFYYDDPDTRNALLDYLLQQFPDITSLQYVINGKGNDSISDLPVHCYAGSRYITENIEGFNFYIGPLSFFQTNARQAIRLYQKIAEFAHINKDDVIFDLYTGIGTIAIYLAPLCQKVYGFESINEAVEEAKMNARINNIENTEFYSGLLKNTLNKSFTRKHGKPDVLITDPPRAGMHEKVIESILAIEPRKVIYISCNPSTQARDLYMLSSKYEIEQVQPVDMFPHTYHIENIVSLNLKKAKK